MAHSKKQLKKVIQILKDDLEQMTLCSLVMSEFLIEKGLIDEFEEYQSPFLAEAKPIKGSTNCLTKSKIK